VGLTVYNVIHSWIPVQTRVGLYECSLVVKETCVDVMFPVCMMYMYTLYVLCMLLYMRCFVIPAKRIIGECCR